MTNLMTITRKPVLAAGSLLALLCAGCDLPTDDQDSTAGDRASPSPVEPIRTPLVADGVTTFSMEVPGGHGALETVGADGTFPELRGTIQVDGSPLLNAQLKVHGAGSKYLYKKSYRVQLSDSIGLARMPAGRQWVLVSNYADRTHLRNSLTYETAAQLGRWSPRVRFVRLFVNGVERGLYMLTERIEVGPNRVDRPLHTTDASGSVQSGVILKREGDDPSFTWDPKVAKVDPFGFGDPLLWTIHFPNPDNFPTTREYIQQFFNKLDADSRDSAGRPFLTEAARNALDRASWIDSNLLHELTNNGDALNKSMYLHTTRNYSGTFDPIVLGPLWDIDGGWGNSGGSSQQGDNLPPTCWSTRVLHRYPSQSNFTTNSAFWDDPEMRRSLRTRWASLRGGVLSDSNIYARVDAHWSQIAAARARDEEILPADKKTMGATSNGSCVKTFENGFRACRCATTLAGEVQILKDSIKHRLCFLDGYLDTVGLPDRFFFYRPGTSYLSGATVGTDGKFTTNFSLNTADTNWTHITAARDNVVVFYKSSDGTVAISTVDPSTGAYSFKKGHPAGLPKGYTHVMGAHSYTVLLNLGTGAGKVVRFSSSGAFTQIRDLSGLTGFNNAVSTAEGKILLYSSSTGATAILNVDACGTFVQRTNTGNIDAGWTHLAPAGPQLVFAYNQNARTGAVYRMAIDGSSIPKMRSYSGFSPWTHVVGNYNGMLVLYDTANQMAVVLRVRRDGTYTQVPNWSTTSTLRTPAGTAWTMMTGR